ncbi:hypothetical protein HK101_004468, partial [Irineochytrium annulatum]
SVSRRSGNGGGVNAPIFTFANDVGANGTRDAVNELIVSVIDPTSLPAASVESPIWGPTEIIPALRVLIVSCTSGLMSAAWVAETLELFARRIREMQGGPGGKVPEPILRVVKSAINAVDMMMETEARSGGDPSEGSLPRGVDMVQARVMARAVAVEVGREPASRDYYDEEWYDGGTGTSNVSPGGTRRLAFGPANLTSRKPFYRWASDFHAALGEGEGPTIFSGTGAAGDFGLALDLNDAEVEKLVDAMLEQQKELLNSATAKVNLNRRRDMGGWSEEARVSLVEESVSGPSNLRIAMAAEATLIVTPPASPPLDDLKTNVAAMMPQMPLYKIKQHRASANVEAANGNISFAKSEASIQFTREWFARVMVDVELNKLFTEFVEMEHCTENMVFYNELNKLEDLIASQTVTTSITEAAAYESARSAGSSHALARFLRAAAAASAYTASAVTTPKASLDEDRDAARRHAHSASQNAASAILAALPPLPPNAAPNNLIPHYVDIFMTFIAAGSKEEVNVTDATRKRIAGALKEAVDTFSVSSVTASANKADALAKSSLASPLLSTIFDPVGDEIVDLLYRDTFKRFVAWRSKVASEDRDREREQTASATGSTHLKAPDASTSSSRKTSAEFEDLQTVDHETAFMALAKAAMAAEREREVLAKLQPTQIEKEHRPFWSRKKKDKDLHHLRERLGHDSATTSMTSSVGTDSQLRSSDGTPGHTASSTGHGKSAAASSSTSANSSPSVSRRPSISSMSSSMDQSDTSTATATASAAASTASKPRSARKHSLFHIKSAPTAEEMAANALPVVAPERGSSLAFPSPANIVPPTTAMRRSNTISKSSSDGATSSTSREHPPPPPLLITTRRATLVPEGSDAPAAPPLSAGPLSGGPRSGGGWFRARVAAEAPPVPEIPAHLRRASGENEISAPAPRETMVSMSAGAMASAVDLKDSGGRSKSKKGLFGWA